MDKENKVYAKTPEKIAEELSLKHASVSILVTVGGKVHMVGMTQDNLDAITTLVKVASDVVIPTGRTTDDLHKFLKV